MTKNLQPRKIPQNIPQGLYQVLVEMRDMLTSHDAQLQAQARAAAEVAAAVAAVAPLPAPPIVSIAGVSVGQYAITFTLSPITYSGADHVEFWRAPAGRNISAASLVGTTKGPTQLVFQDGTVTPSTSYAYWYRNINSQGVGGPFQNTSGTVYRTSDVLTATGSGLSSTVIGVATQVGTNNLLGSDANATHTSAGGTYTYAGFGVGTNGQTIASLGLVVGDPLSLVGKIGLTTGAATGVCFAVRFYDSTGTLLSSVYAPSGGFTGIIGTESYSINNAPIPANTVYLGVFGTYAVLNGDTITWGPVTLVKGISSSNQYLPNFRHKIDTLDVVQDGPTYGKTVNTALTGNQIDFSKSGFVNKNQDNVADGSTYARVVSSDMTTNRVDFSKSLLNKQLDNIPDGSTYGRTVNTALTSNQIDFSKSGFVNKNVDNVSDGSTYARTRGTTLLSGVPALYGQTGKNACPNPGFESNLVNTTLNHPYTAIGTTLIDGWFIPQCDPCWQLLIDTQGPHGGANCLLIRLLANTSIPANTTYVGQACSSYMPIRSGDTISFGSYISWYQALGLPAGLAVAIIFIAEFRDVNYNYLGGSHSAAPGPVNGINYTNETVNYVVPALIGGVAPAFMRMVCYTNITNSTGGALSTPNGLAADVRFDDIFTFISDPTIAGAVKAYADFTDNTAGGHVGKNVDNVADGATYARSRGNTLQSGVPKMTGQFGKNVCPNPSFSQNLSGAALSIDVAAGNPLIDGWFVATDGGDLFDVLVTQSNPRTGANALAIVLKQNIGVPANTTIQGYPLHAQVPVKIGDTVSWGGYVFWWQDGIGALPAGVSGDVGAYLFIYDSTGTFITAQSANGLLTVNNGTNYVLQDGTYVIPALILGKVPAFVTVVPFVQIYNSNGVAFNTGAHWYMNAQLSDFYLCVDDPTVPSGKKAYADLTDTTAGGHNWRGSVPPTVNGLTFSYSNNGTGTSLTISWPAFTLYTADGNTIAVPLGNQVFATANATPYYFYPYYNVAGASVNFAGGANTAPSPVEAAQQYLAGNISLYAGALQITTSAGGSGSGKQGGCLHQSTGLTFRRSGVERTAFAGDLVVGDELMTDGGWQPILEISHEKHDDWIHVGCDIPMEPSLYAILTPTQPLYLEDGTMVRARDLTLGMRLKAKGRLVDVTKLSLDCCHPADKIIIKIAPPHLFYLGAGDLLVSNGNPKP